LKSPLAELYRNFAFRLEWDNDLPYTLAQHLVRLRRFREISQAELADRMATSQAKIARIEGGEENVTLRTIQKIARALHGRLTLALQPAEMQLPRLPQWWQYPASASVAWGNVPPAFTTMLTLEGETGTAIGARWDLPTVKQQLAGALESGEMRREVPEKTAQYVLEITDVKDVPTPSVGVSDSALLDETAL